MTVEFRSEEEVEKEIALWGPPASGKTWLINAFARNLQKYNDRDPDFTYELLNDGGLPIYQSDPPEVGGTEQIEDTLWFFRRKPRKESNAHTVSAHTHIINVHDDKGARTVDLTNRPTRIGILGSPYVLLMLDPTRLTGTQLVANVNIQSTQGDDASIDREQQDISSDQLTQQEYTEKVGKLLQLLAQNAHPDRSVAVCITKVDLLGTKRRSPWRLIDAYFGANMLRQLEGYKTTMNMEAFSISSAGYFDDSQPNIDLATGEVLKPDEWEPYNVEAPFFWLFQRIEHRRLAQAGGRITKFFFKGERSRIYISYPIRRK